MYDVIVIGAGPGGSAAAHFLAQQNLSVQLLDKADFPRDKTCGDGLTPRALAVLAELGLLSELTEAGCRMNEATVYAPKGTPITTHMPKRPDMPDYMLAVPRLVLDNHIQKLAVSSGAVFQPHVHVTDIEQVEGGVLVKGRQGKAPFSNRGRIAIIAIGASVKLLLTLGLLKETPRMILAARTYYEDLEGLSGRFEFHFDGIPLPGYGWIFPLSETSANVGAGVLQPGRLGRQRDLSARQVLEQFLAQPAMKAMLANARQVGPVKGYPLRTDFATAPSYGPRILLVGEAAGLVNPLTGEGVDYALESGKVAAEHLLEAFAAGDFSQERLAAYDHTLRQRFQRLFVFSSRIRDWYLHKPVLNRLVSAAQRRDELRRLFTDIVLGNADAAQAVSLKTVAKIVLP